MPEAEQPNLTIAEQAHLDKRHHMHIPWQQATHTPDLLAVEADLSDKTCIVARAGLLMLSNGTGGWRVRDQMNRIARVLGVTCTADLGLVGVSCTCTDESGSYTQVLSLSTTHVDTERIQLVERFVRKIEHQGETMTVAQMHVMLHDIENHTGNYKGWQLGLAAALACGAFTFLLGGGVVEMICAFVGAGVGNLLRHTMLSHRITQFAAIAASVAAACLAYLLAWKTICLFMPEAINGQAGYIGAMLFIIPGFPLITAGLDLVKMDLRSGVERLAYAAMVIGIATTIGWMMALVTQIAPVEFAPQNFDPVHLCLMRVAMSFCGVFGFSIMFNSPMGMAFVAGCLGALANTLRLELIDLTAMPLELAAFVGALTAGLLASAVGPYLDFPRISLTVPSVVIMVPGLFMYRAMYYMGNFADVDALGWFVRSVMIVLCLPMGLALARILTDKRWRYKNL